MTVDRLGQVFDLYRTTGRSRTALALVVANAIPLVGVLFFGWSLLTILVLYWVENGIVGLWNIPKIILAEGSLVPGGIVPPSSRTAGLIGGKIPGAGRVAMAGFFLIHYGFFWIGHGVFVFVLPNFAGAFSSGPSFCDYSNPPGGFPSFGVGGCGPGPFGDVIRANIAIAAVALFLSHGASFFLNYLGRGEHRRTSAPQQMFAPYGRVVVLHLTILFGAFVAALLGAPIGVLIILVVLKTAFDLRLHLREHRGTLLTDAG